MRFVETSLPGVIVIEPDVHRDARGLFSRDLSRGRSTSANGIGVAFVQDNHSRSTGGTLRGLHLQVRRPQAKLVRAIEGEIFDVAVDVRRGSPTFGRWTGTKLSAENFRQCYVPPGFAHGFSVLTPVAQVEYKCSDVLRSPGRDRHCLE